MAIYHLSVKPVSRAGGRSATGASAYRAAELVRDHTSGEIFDYSRKRGVEHSEIVLPDGCAKQDIHWAREREQLWNAAERAENRSNSRVAREYEIALPHELNKEQRLALTREFAAEIANRHGVAVDFAIHAPHRSGDERNHHAHLLATTREITPTGLGEKVSIEWSDTNRRKAELEPGRKEIESIRDRWAELTNEKLHEHGHQIRVDHRSLEAQGIEREPTTHLGPAVTGLERRGEPSHVLERIGLEQASRQLEQAAERGRVEREHQEIRASVLDVSGDLARAKREREMTMAKEHTPRPTIEELQRQGRENWLAMRAEQKEREKSLGQTVEKGIEKTPSRSLDEERQQAAERWREYRREQELHPGRTPERTGPEKDLERGKERDGPEIEFE